jgi:putative N6-adenine-specific DNA methylase
VFLVVMKPSDGALTSRRARAGSRRFSRGELTALGAQDVKATDGGVAFAASCRSACARILESRFASRVLWRVGGGAYRDERALYELVKEHRLEASLRRDAHAARRRLGHALALAEPRVRDAARQGCRMRPLPRDVNVRPSIDKRAPDVRVFAYLTERDATIYLDTSGEPLFKRGYRRDAEEAPLRENLAAGIVALTGWKPGVAFLDPMCGSGTIVAEAALMAADRAPGLAERSASRSSRGSKVRRGSA